MERIWKSVKGYEGIYEVSNRGEVKSLDRIKINAAGREQFLAGCILSTTISGGSLSVTLSNKEGKKSKKLVKDLVAAVFIEGFKDQAIKFKDGDSMNCSVDNLELAALSSTKRKANNVRKSRSKKIMCVETGEVFASVKDAALCTGFQPVSISHAISLGCDIDGQHFKEL